MKINAKWIFLIILFLKIFSGTPALVHADSVIQSPKDIEVDFILLGWPGEIPESLEVKWKMPEIEGIAGYNIYEVFTGQNGNAEYVKVGSVNGNEQSGFVNGDIFGYHSFAVTAVMLDGRESDYSEIAAGGLFYHLQVWNTGATSSSVSIEWGAPDFQDADRYEIWYRVNEFEWWQYYEDYYKEKNISYEIIRGLDKDTKKCVISRLKPDTEYVIMVQAYYNGEILDRSDFFQVKTEKETASYDIRETEKRESFKVKRVSLQKPANLNGRKMSIKWKRISRAEGYEITYAGNKKFKKKKTRFTDKHSFVTGKLKRGRTYYVKVRAYKLDSAGEKVYGKYSKVRKLKICR